MLRFLLFASLTVACPIARPAELAEVVRGVEITDGTQVDVAVFSADGLCATHSSGTPAGGRLRYHAASISKLFTAIVVLQLRDEGKLKLEDPIGKFVPEFAASSIRIQHLLTHTSGLRDRIRTTGRETTAQVDDYIRTLARQELAGEPGSQWAYSDAGFNLLGRLVANVTGASYSDAMRQRLLVPLGMTVSSFDIRQPKGVEDVRAIGSGGTPLAHPWDLAFAPSSGLQTDARDLARFGAGILSVAASRPSGLLSPNTLAEMTSVRVATEWTGISQGYGWQLIAGPPRVWRHAGSEAGFESLFTLYPDLGFGIVVMGNRKGWPRFKLESALAAAWREGRLACEAKAAESG